MTAPATLPMAPEASPPVEPYKLLFPLGTLLAWAGVLHWLLHALGLFARYHPVFHAIAQIQGFLTCFAVGFLFTAIPARTGTSPPHPWQLAVGMVSPVLTTAAAWSERWFLSQISWMVLVIVLAEFTIRRLAAPGAARRTPASFVWVPISLAMGFGGSLLILLASLPGSLGFWYHDLGRLFLLQGMFLGLVLGIGAMLLPVLLHSALPVGAARRSDEGWDRGIHTAAAGVLALSFWVENSGAQRLGLGLRALLLLGVLVWQGGITRRPTLPGIHRRFALLAAWLLPIGYSLAAAFPLAVKGGLHVAFIGGFALLSFAVALHVTLSHGGYARRATISPWPVWAFGALLVLAALLRALADFDRIRYFLWIGAAATSFLVATVFWAVEAVPRLLRRPPPYGG